MPFVGLILVSLAISVSLSVLALAVMPKAPAPQGVAPNKLEDFSFPTIEEGAPQGVIFGDAWIKGWHVLEYANLRIHPITKTPKHYK